jgi:CheY-like chemotaxis protein
MSKPRQIVLVGHCAADVFSLKLVIEQAAPGVTVQNVNDMRALEKLPLADCLLLVNRKLSWGFSVSDGVELIRQLRQRADAPAAMLISNLPDAQAQAEQAGALPGFGKAELAGEKARRRLQAALGLDWQQ